jgi:hypothetical protein
MPAAPNRSDPVARTAARVERIIRTPHIGGQRCPKFASLRLKLTVGYESGGRSSPIGAYRYPRITDPNVEGCFCNDV